MILAYQMKNEQHINIVTLQINENSGLSKTEVEPILRHPHFALISTQKPPEGYVTRPDIKTRA